jgi:broad specificity phosphatase PhoE
MPMLYLIRHGRAAASWDTDLDPGLDDLGREQAEAVARRLMPLGPIDLIVSPMARTRETAAPLARAWNLTPRIESRVSEIPSPTADLVARGQWLRGIGERNWSELETSLLRWRADVLAALHELARDTVVVTHYIAINVAVGAAAADDRVVNFRPDHCSVTILQSDGERLVLVERGSEGATRVL